MRQAWHLGAASPACGPRSWQDFSDFSFGSRTIFNDFELFKVSRFCSSVVTQACFSQIPGPILSHLTLGCTQLGFGVCSLTKLA